MEKVAGTAEGGTRVLLAAIEAPLVQSGSTAAATRGTMPTTGILVGWACAPLATGNMKVYVKVIMKVFADREKIVRLEPPSRIVPTTTLLIKALSPPSRSDINTMITIPPTPTGRMTMTMTTRLEVRRRCRR